MPLVILHSIQASQSTFCTVQKHSWAAANSSYYQTNCTNYLNIVFWQSIMHKNSPIQVTTQTLLTKFCMIQKLFRAMSVDHKGCESQIYASSLLTNACKTWCLRGQGPISVRNRSIKWWYHVCLMLKNLKLGTNKLKLDFKLCTKILFRRNNIHQEIDHWNRHWFGAKWHVIVPNSVAPVKPIVCKLIYMLQG